MDLWSVPVNDNSYILNLVQNVHLSSSCVYICVCLCLWKFSTKREKIDSFSNFADTLAKVANKDTVSSVSLSQISLTHVIITITL